MINGALGMVMGTRGEGKFTTYPFNAPSGVNLGWHCFSLPFKTLTDATVNKYPYLTLVEDLSRQPKILAVVRSILVVLRKILILKLVW